jgi:hypothetical protein
MTGVGITVVYLLRIPTGNLAFRRIPDGEFCLREAIESVGFHVVVAGG